jgi:excisionase family DNA binding protein
MDKRQETEKTPFSLRELSEQLGVSYRHLHRAVKERRIQVVRFGHLLRVSEREVSRLREHGF